MISSTLLLICLSLIWGMVSFGSRYLRVSQARLDLQNQALRALTTINRELSETDTDTVKAVNTTSLQGVSFASPRDPVSGVIEYDNLGRMKWSKFVCYYVGDPDGDGNQKLLRKVEVFPAILYPPPPDDVLKMVSLNTPVSTVAMYVSNFAVIPGSPINVTLECSLNNSALKKDWGMTVHTGVYPRN